MNHPGRGFEALPVAARPVVSNTIGREDPAYQVRGLAARNPAQGLGLRFAPTGVIVRSGVARGSLALTAVGRPGAVRAVPSAAVRASGNRVTYARPGLSEWYVNGPLGLEQGFDFARRPAGGGTLSLVVRVSGWLRPRLEHGIVLFGRAGLSYGGLRVTDARERAIPAWLSVGHGQVLIHVRDARATYPLRVDPFVRQGASLRPSGEAGGGQLGLQAVALSSDGNTALIGARADGSNVGAAWVFTRTGATWAQQSAKLTRRTKPAPASSAPAWRCPQTATPR